MNNSPLPALLREARDAYVQEISPRVSNAGFDDITVDRVLALMAMTERGSKPGDLEEALGVTRLGALEIIYSLVSAGYLNIPANPGAGRKTMVDATERGQKVASLATEGITAARWAGFPFRQGDIVVSTSPKTGTTWMQMICALLIFQTTELPAPLSELSPWLDAFHIPRDKVYASLAAQGHRRVIKTHMPLSKITVDPRATYIVIARSPLDSAVSLYHQANNLNHSSAGQNMYQLGPERQLPPLREWLVKWIDTAASPEVDKTSLPGFMAHLSDAWSRRSQPNVVLVRYEDLWANLDGEMRRLAERLGIGVPGQIWPDLVRAATLKEMRAAADRIQPVGDRLKSNAAFFRRGGTGSGAEFLAADELARYHAQVARLAPPDLLGWLNQDQGTTGLASA